MPATASALFVLAGLMRAGWNSVTRTTLGDARFAFFTAFLLWRKPRRHALVVAAMSPNTHVLVLRAMQEAPCSHVAPARELSLLFAALFGGPLLDEGEGERGSRALGALCIAGGVVAPALG